MPFCGDYGGSIVTRLKKENIKHILYVFILTYNIQSYYKRNRQFQCCIEMKLLMVN